MALEAAVVRFTSPASSGTVDVTSSGFGTPTAALIFETYTGGNITTYNDHAGFQVGMWASTGGTGTEACQAFYSANNAASGQPAFWDNNGSLIKADNAGTDYGTVSAVITDGLRLNFTGYYDQDFIAILFKGTAGVSLTSDTVGASSTKDFSLGHEPHVVFMSCVDVDGSNNEHISFGVGHYDGTTFDQIHISHTELQSADPTQNRLGLFNNSIGAHRPGGGQEFVASRPSADTLRLTMEGNGAAEDIIFLAFELDDPTTEFAVGVDQCTLTAANTEAYTSPGFTPAMLGVFGSMLSDVLNGYLTSYKAAGFTVGAADSTSNRHSASFRSQDGVATSYTGSYQDNANILSALKHNNTTIARQADLDSFDATGFTLDWTAVNANAQYFGWWAVAAVSTPITGTGALTSQNASVSGAGTVTTVHTGAGALSAQASALAGTCVIGRIGSGVITAQAAVITGAGVREITGTGLLESDASTMTGTGLKSVKAEGALAAGDVSMSGAGNRGINSVGFLQADSATINGTGTISSYFIGNGTLNTQDSAIAGAGVLGRTGTGVLSAGAVAINGTGLRITNITGTGALVAQAALIYGTEIPDGMVIGTGAHQVEPVVMAGVAIVSFWSDRDDASAVWADQAGTLHVWTDKTDESTRWTQQ